MRLDLIFLTLPLIPVLLACAAGRAETSVADNAQVETPTSPQDEDKAARVPTQLAQYPGAPFEDQSGNLWFATVLEGLIRHDGREFVNFTTKEGLASNMVRGILEDDDGVLWIATSGGVSKFDGESFTTLTDYVDTPITYSFTKEGDHRDVWDVFEDRHGDLWIATVAGVFRHDGTSFVPFPMPVVAAEGSFEFGPKMVYSIYEDAEGALWFGTDGAGAVHYDGTTMTVYTAQANGLCSDRVCTILQDSRGHFWFGTSSGGVSRYDGTTFTTHLRSPTFSKHTGWGRYMSILEDRAGTLWFGACSAPGGVYSYDGESFQHHAQGGGVPIGGVPSIVEDRAGTLWLGSTTGVFRYGAEGFVNFTRGG